MVGNNIRHYLDGCVQIWDDYIRLPPTTGCLSQMPPLCWERCNHSYYAWSKTAKYLNNVSILSSYKQRIGYLLIGF